MLKNNHISSTMVHDSAIVISPLIQKKKRVYVCVLVNYALILVPLSRSKFPLFYGSYKYPLRSHIHPVGFILILLTPFLIYTSIISIFNHGPSIH